MDKQDFMEFSELLQNTSVHIYRQTLSAETMSLYFSALSPVMTLAEFKVAMSAYLMDDLKCAFFPKPGDLGRQHKLAFGSSEESTWLRVMNAVRLVGRNRSVTFDDPRIHAAITAMGGWVSLCESLETTDYHLRKRFIELLPVSDTSNAPQFLIGYQDIYNADKGLLPSPVRAPGGKEQQATMITARA